MSRPKDSTRIRSTSFADASKDTKASSMRVSSTHSVAIESEVAVSVVCVRENGGGERNGCGDALVGLAGKSRCFEVGMRLVLWASQRL